MSRETEHAVYLKEEMMIDLDTQHFPKWARACPEVMALAMRDLAYRCELWRGTTRQYQQFLLDEARTRRREYLVPEP